MALPPKEMNTSCLRCSAVLDDDEVICPSCGANRDVERAVAAELNPAIASLQRWLGVLGGVAIVVGLVSYEHLHDKVASGALWTAVAPAIVGGAVMLVLAALARKAPFAISIIALATFGLAWLIAIVQNPMGALGPGLSLVGRIMFLVVLVGAAQSGYKARRIRAIADEKFPAARVIRP